MTHARTWLVFANEDKCNHTKSFLEKRFISWVQRNHFQIGDIVYVFMSDTRCVRFKAKVTAMNQPRQDKEYWIAEAPDDITFRFELIKEYEGNELNESELKKHGLKSKSLQQPNYRNKELLEYIKSKF